MKASSSSGSSSSAKESKNGANKSKKKLMEQARVSVANKQRPVDLIRLLVKENQALTIKVIKHWLKK